MVSLVDREGRWVAARMHVAQISPFKHKMGQGGLLVVGVRSSSGLPGLLAVCDETDAYGGGSATNSMERVLTVMGKHWEGNFALKGCNIVELDSTGNWDLVLPTWEGDQVVNVCFRPLRWIECKPCSFDALKGAFGQMATTLTAALSAVGAAHPI